MKRSGRLAGLFRTIIDPETALQDAWNSGRPGRSGLLKVLVVVLVVVALLVLYTVFPELGEDR